MNITLNSYLGYFVRTFCLIFLAMVCHRVDAANITWNVSSGNWDVASNWAGGAVPTASATAIIDSGFAALLPASVSGTSWDVVIGSTTSGSITISGGNLSDTYGYLGNNAGSNGTAT